MILIIFTCKLHQISKFSFISMFFLSFVKSQKSGKYTMRIILPLYWLFHTVSHLNSKIYRLCSDGVDWGVHRSLCVEIEFFRGVCILYIWRWYETIHVILFDALSFVWTPLKNASRKRKYGNMSSLKKKYLEGMHFHLLVCLFSKMLIEICQKHDF